MNLEKYVVEVHATIQEALIKIENNHKGFILIQDISSKIIGIATDGDIRRKLLENLKLNDTILNCVNKNFISARTDTPRELLLKQLDHQIKVIPILDKDEKLISIVSRDFMPERNQQKVFARSKSPVRISFGGGGSDTSAYFTENKAAVINATISLYSHSTLKIRDDEKIIIYSLDLNDKIEFNNINELLIYNGKFS
jgi:D-glycero-alpha-D-manno-heptose-7-phosphate kinase